MPDQEYDGVIVARFNGGFLDGFTTSSDSALDEGTSAEAVYMLTGGVVGNTFPGLPADDAAHLKSDIDLLKSRHAEHVYRVTHAAENSRVLYLDLTYQDGDPVAPPTS